MKTLTNEVQKTYDERGYYGEYAIDYSDFEDYSNDPNAQYTYNKNGAMTHDPKKGANFVYDKQGMPLKVSVPAIDGTIDYNYSPTGEKLRAIYKWRPGLSLDPWRIRALTATASAFPHCGAIMQAIRFTKVN